MGRIRHSQGLLRAFLLLASFIILALAMAPMPVAAIMGTDFGFESGLTGWSTYGNVSTGSGGDYLAVSNIWTVGPYETKMAVVGPSGNSGVFTTVADALGLSASSQSYLTTTFPNITNMAYIYADIPLAAGESFTMAWNYVATDYAPYNDASFCSLVNLNDAGDVPLVNGFNAEVSILGATVTGTGNYSTGDYGSTGWQTAAFQASGAGTYRLGFTVFNLTDTQYNPYLFVDKDPGTTLKNGVPFNPVPPDDDPPPRPVTVAPSVTTGTASAITAVSASVSGHVTSDGGEPVTERGIVFGLAPNPTTAGSKAAGGSGTGLFSAQLTGLAPGATYYARAYAINVKGTSYGDSISFTTVPPAPTVAAATAVTASSFTANWTAVAGATGYRLDVATDSSFLHVVSGYANLDAGSATSRTVSGLAAATPYYIRVRATNSAGTSPNSNTVTATTAKADQSISFPPLASRTYGDADFNPGATATSGLTMTYTSSNPQVATIVDNQVHIVGQGTATITAAQAGNGSWNPAPDQAQTLTVLRKTVTLAGTLAASNKTYDGTTAAIVTADGLSLVGLVGDDQVTVNPVGIFSDKNAAPGKTVSLTAATSLSGTDSENYTLSLAGAPAGQAAILQRLLTLSAFHADDKIYDGTVAAFGTGFEDDRISGDDLTFSYAAAFSDADIGVAKPVTFSDIAISGGLDAMNYTLADASGSTQATIERKNLHITLVDKSKTYGDADPELTWQVTAGSLIGTDAPTGTLNRAAGEDVGEYAISQGSLAFGDNYAVSFASNNLTITARAITVTADVKTKVYGDADPELTWQVTDGSLVGTDAPLGSLSREAGEDVGVYTIEQGSLAFGGNYCVSFVGSDLAIASRSLTIQAVSCSKTYGDADPAWQVMYENLASWDSEAVVQGLGLARAPGEAVGSYVISPSGAKADNYTVIMLSGTLTIDKRPLTITAAAQTKGYGTADPAFSYALTAGSLIGDDSLTGELSRESGENVGSYDILQNSLTAGGNYQITFVGAELTITPYAEPLLHGSVANGHDPDNSGQISFVAESDDGYAFAYWSDGHTVFSTNPILTNPVGGITGYHPVIWPIGPSTDLQAIGMSAQNESAVLFLNGVVRMVLPAHVDPEAVIAVTACDAVAGQDLLPSGMAAAQPFFCFLRSENLVGERIRIEIDLAQAGIQLGDEERESLTLYRWNEEEQIWKTVEIARQGVDWETGILWAEVEQFSTYGLFYTPQLVQTGETPVNELVQTGETPVNGAWLLLLVGGCLMALILARKRLPGLGGRSDADA